MWFRRKPEELDTRDRVRGLEDRLEALERGFKSLRLEWEETYERLYKVMGRLNARLRASKTDEPEGGGHQDTPPLAVPPQLQPGYHERMQAHRRRRAVLPG